MYYTTLNDIRAHSLCCTGWDKLLSHLGKTGPDDEPLSLLTILESNGIYDAIWALRAVNGPSCERDARIFAVRCVRQAAQHLLTDPRSLDALDVAELYAIGEATIENLEAAKDAAWAAIEKEGWAAKIADWKAANAATETTAEDAWDAAETAAWDAIDAAAWDAAQAEAWGEAWDEAWDDAWEAIEADFRALFCAEDSTCPA